jgi:hypothetical protein
MQNAKCKMQNAKRKTQNAKRKMQNAKCKTQNAKRIQYEMFQSKLTKSVTLGDFLVSL